ncbi:DNA (cytosine-5)-methyltransferase 1 [Bacillus sp. SLBN-46]|uniref:DNA cytosine methyltransferase n=1 Tax=Bacillus sp. SLBN-46 TaxID=3042283 RepID=UPI002857F067|nr:DNA cytosine methyltransferase [Bacillus sp. SLBN-46]MDR6125207.1 DNA (cytosine-5)-methyltransferase 1 [Bacillus sp. SLBN-46]
MNLKAISLFSSAGIGELLLKDIGINVVAANELIPKRAECYKYFNPDTVMINGDITLPEVKEEIKSYISDDVKLLIATPPCQGLSTLGKNKIQSHFEEDERNYLIFDIFDIIESGNFDYILIENVPKFLNMYFPYNGEYLHLEQILNQRYSDSYIIDAAILNAKDYGIAQTRPRAIIKMYKKGLNWGWPVLESEIALNEAIGHLPSLESGEDSGIPWHYAKVENDRAVLALKHTPTGQSALKNEVYYPKKENGERILGFHNTFKRMVWDQPAHARTTYCGSMSSHNNVHPGRIKPDGTYSDARVLTLLETFIVSSIPKDIAFPTWVTDNFIRTIIGESIPPLMLMKIIREIGPKFEEDKLADDLQNRREKMDTVQAY